jgi:hypothetical protein
MATRLVGEGTSDYAPGFKVVVRAVTRASRQIWKYERAYNGEVLGKFSYLLPW